MQIVLPTNFYSKMNHPGAWYWFATLAPAMAMAVKALPSIIFERIAYKPLRMAPLWP